MHIYQTGTTGAKIKAITTVKKAYKASIVFVHGLQGHPYKTWAAKVRKNCQPDVSEPPRKKSRTTWNIPLRVLSRKPIEPTGEDVASQEERTIETQSSKGTESTVYWPSELLPKECMPPRTLNRTHQFFYMFTLRGPMPFCSSRTSDLTLAGPLARILAWGYDTKVTKYTTGPVNKNSIFSHAKDLLYSLARERPIGRHLIFIAHSLGGIVVKEVSTTRGPPLTSNSQKHVYVRVTKTSRPDAPQLLSF
jgi:protein SERAC1